MKATITEKHLDTAIALRETPGYLISRRCVAALLCRELYGEIFQSCAWGVIITTTGAEIRVIDVGFNSLITKFDLFQYDSIRAMLPLEVWLPELSTT